MQSLSILNWLFPLRTNPYQVGTKVAIHPNWKDSSLPISSKFRGKIGTIIGIYQGKALVELSSSVWDSVTLKNVRSAWFHFDSITPV